MGQELGVSEEVGLLHPCCDGHIALASLPNPGDADLDKRGSSSGVRCSYRVLNLSPRSAGCMLSQFPFLMLTLEKGTVGKQALGLRMNTEDNTTRETLLG